MTNFSPSQSSPHPLDMFELSEINKRFLQHIPFERQMFFRGLASDTASLITEHSDVPEMQDLGSKSIYNLMLGWEAYSIAVVDESLKGLLSQCLVLNLMEDTIKLYLASKTTEQLVEYDSFLYNYCLIVAFVRPKAEELVDAVSALVDFYSERLNPPTEKFKYILDTTRVYFETVLPVVNDYLALHLNTHQASIQPQSNPEEATTPGLTK